MAYIIDQANVYKESKVLKCSILINENRIDYMSPNLDRLRFIRMNFSNYLLTPGHVMLSTAFSANLPFSQFKETMQEKYISKGCTSVIAVSEVTRERELDKNYEKTKSHLLNSPIDYYIGIKIPLKILTPPLIRACKRKKIPILFVEINDVNELLSIPWGWVREALFPNAFPVVPIWKEKHKSRLQKKRRLELWNKMVLDLGITSIETDLVEDFPLTKDVLKKMGIFPAKGDIRTQGEIDYNLYELNDLSDSVEELSLLDYHSLIPSITMHKGKPMKIQSKVYFRPGFGKECKVILPGRFSSNF
jgi:hypothetical protein